MIVSSGWAPTERSSFGAAGSAVLERMATSASRSRQRGQAA